MIPQDVLAIALRTLKFNLVKLNFRPGISVKRYRIITVCCAATTFLLSTVALSQSFTDVRGQSHFEVEIFESDSNGESYTQIDPESLASSDDPQLNALENYVNGLEQACAGSDRCSTNAGLARMTQEICDNPGDCPHYLLVEPYQNSELESSEE